MVTAATGAAFAGTVTVYITIDGGTQAVGSVSSGVCTNEGNGYYSYRPAAAETDGALIAFTFTGTGAIPTTVQVETISTAQAQALAVGDGLLSLTTRQLICDALQIIGAVNALGDLSPEDAELGRRTINRLLDQWNTDRARVYGDRIITGTISAGTQPQTVGPDSTNFTVTPRPVRITQARLIVEGIRYPLPVQTLTDWAAVPVPELTSAWPQIAYWDPAWPDGNLYLWPVASAAYDIELVVPVQLGSLALTDTFSLPQGYQQAITLTLAEQLVSPMRVPMPPYLPSQAREARADILASNVDVPRLNLRGSFPGARRSWWDYRTGGFT